VRLEPFDIRQLINLVPLIEFRDCSRSKSSKNKDDDAQIMVCFKVNDWVLQLAKKNERKSWPRIYLIEVG